MSFTDWPGVGDVPEAEDPGLRAELIEKEKERHEAEAEEFKARSEEQKAFYSGQADAPADDPADDPAAPPKASAPKA